MFRKSVVLFMLKNRKAFEPIGSGTFVFHDGKLLIVSAAHVFRDLAKDVGNGNIYMHVLDRVFNLGKVKILLSNNDGFNYIREDDPLDLGVIEAPDEVIDYCNGKISFVEREYIETSEKLEYTKFYQSIGFPGIKNTKLADKAARLKRRFIPEMLLYSGENCIDAVPSNGRISEDYHVVMNFEEKHNVDDDGIKVNIPDLYGMSGGLIQGVFDYVAKSNGLYPTCAAGILIENDDELKVLIGVKFSVIYEWLDNHAALLNKQGALS